MTALQFPKMFSAGSTKIVSDDIATKQNFKLLLQSNVGELFGDPEYGSPLVQKLYLFNTTILEDILKDYVYTMICNYFPQLAVTKDNIVITRTNTSIEINLFVFNIGTLTTQELTTTIAI